MGVYARQQSIGANKALIAWLYTGLIMTFLIVVIGGITRLTESGLSMVDWRPIMGSIPPLSAEEWQQTFEKYKSSPQFQEHNFDFELADFKSIFWWEYIHRAFARLISIVFMIPFLLFLVGRKISLPLFFRLLLVLFLGGAQGLIGWYMVKSGLIDVPRVSHFRLAAHLLTAFTTIGYIYWVVLELKHQKAPLTTAMKPFRKWSLALLILVGLQIMYGAFVAGKDAGLIHTTWPLMDGHFIHPSSVSLSSFWENLTFNSSMIQFVHRTLAILVFVFAWALKWEASKRNLKGALNKTYTLIAGMVSLQFILGVLTLIMKVPILLAILHQFGALVVLLLVIRSFFFTKADAERAGT